MLNVKNHLENMEKLRELILHICQRSEGDSNFGSVKLNKLLFFSDFNAYLQNGKPITGQEYQKLENGPAPRAMKLLIDEMQEEKMLVLAERNFHGYSQKKPMALREPDLSAFTAAEIALVDSQIQQFWRMNGSEISNHSHGFLGWRLAEIGEAIPYAAALLDLRELTQQEKNWAHELDLTGVEAMLS